ncbi:MAG: valine--tRNA ligase [Verrucomicrobia bacterium]|nr:valine--tRNA ligase [Verrucomicrobiota bacterium]MCF7708817.1 valine--tRNA ligase [Verrucomicrobiota bacterium]
MAEIPKAYEPQEVEKHWNQYWLNNSCFRANPDSAKPAYSIVIPPPNVTGILHLGHVLNNTLQDVLARIAGMKGFETLWLPGTDHAGIATQVVVEKTLRAEGLTKHDLGREKFIERVWEWKEKHGGIIIEQLKKLGCSCDWARERFTMDAEYSRSVTETFIDLYNKGLIYRGKRMVNWCPVSMTALSDEEVSMKTLADTMYYFKVEIAENPGTFLTIATTRPETIPGDSGIAVNPKDKRYAEFIGKHAIRPLPHKLPPEEKLIPIVPAEHVEFEFGTGVLKVTPAHDKTDFEIGKQHGLDFIEVINANATMNRRAGKDLENLDRDQARVCAWDLLEKLGAAVKKEPYEHNVGFSERADVPVEPRLSEQWFLKYPSQDKARQAVVNGDIRFYPDRWAKVFNHWMENIQDWCISRQLWWGHRIPIWYRDDEIRCQAESPGDGWTQDPDVLDTWFSSWLWPFATMDEQTQRKFYPTSVLVTAPEILFFWVARMIMAGFEYTGEKPFSHVYLTGIVRDKLGRKMSKSLGNSPDPLDLIDKYGADALRFGVMRSAPLGQDVLFDEQHVELGRNFCNKLWNVCRFRQLQGETVKSQINPDLLTSDDKWILARLDAAIAELNTALNEYRFTESTHILYRFFWSEYCDWYVEAAKSALYNDDQDRKHNTLAVIDFILSTTLRLFHPFLPFITEELWQDMGYNKSCDKDRGDESIVTAPWPEWISAEFKTRFGIDRTNHDFAAQKYELVTQARNLRRETNIPSNKKIRFVFKPRAHWPQEESASFKLLLNAEPLEINPEFNPPKGTPTTLSPLGELYMPLEGVIDVEAEKARLTKEIEKIKTEISKVEQRLANPAFMEKAPAHVREENLKRKTDWQSKLDHAQSVMNHLCE